MRKDWRGQTLNVGYKVVYPGRMGSSLWLREGVIEEIHSDAIVVRLTYVDNWQGGGRRVTIRSRWVTRVA